jgi:ribonucleoside-diphosphate reductase alpha chain
MDNYRKYIHKSRYARFIDEKARRENWEETVQRLVDFYSNKFPDYASVLSNGIRSNILEMEVMPSMRSMMTAGPALERDNISGYNCSYIAVDNIKSFSEALYILMNGTGLGFSVERQYVNMLPAVAEDFYDTDTTIFVKDSKLGWATSLHELITLLYQGKVPKWDLTKLRPAGARLKTFGGRSSGPEPLKDLFLFVVAAFKKAAGRKLNSIECHDIMCKIGAIVVVGGVRRSALISLSNLSDERMRAAKNGQWWEDYVHRALANNSVAYTEKPDIGVFMKEWVSLYESKSGERGIFNRVSAVKQAKVTGRREYEGIDFGTNPCGEILLRPNEFCNLSEIVARSGDTLDRLKEKVKYATILGTFQATLVDFKYIRNIWKKNCEEERLLGVSLTGIMDHQVLSGREGHAKLAEWLLQLKQVAIDTNKEWSAKLGINQSVAITTIKPSGCRTIESSIKTTAGNQTMVELMALAGYDIDDYLDQEHVWIVPNDLTAMPQVYDENNELQNITKLYINGLSPVIEIEFDDGATHKFTPNHKLLTHTGWKRVDELTVDDEIVSF